MTLPEMHMLPEGINQEFIERRRFLEMTRIQYEKLCYMITLINWFRVISFYSNEEANNWAYLSRRFLERFIGRGYVTDILGVLDALDIVECDNRYLRGEKPYGYRLKEPYLSSPIRNHPIAHDGLLEAIRAYNAEQSLADAISDTIYESIRNNLQRFRFSDDAAGIIRRRRGARQAQAIYCISLIQDESSFFSIDARSGRCFTAITSTPKNLREHLTIDGEQTVEIDLNSSQPQFLATLYDSSNLRHSREKARYLSFIENDFYAGLVKASGLNIKDRRKMKIACYSRILFNRTPEPTGKLWQAFRRLFPYLAGLVAQRKRELTEDGSNLAIELQRKEADTVIHEAGGCLVRRGIPFTTVHDSIICKRRDEQTVRRLLGHMMTKTVRG